MDEPTSGLDPQSRLSLWDLMLDLNADGQTIVLMTHYMEEADRLCRRVAIMDHGRFLALDTPANLKRSVGVDTIVTVRASGDQDALAALLADSVEGTARVRQSDSGVELHVQNGTRVVGHVVSVAEKGGYDVADVAVTEPSLETVFINLTGRELRET